MAARHFEEVTCPDEVATTACALRQLRQALVGSCQQLATHEQYWAERVDASERHGELIAAALNIWEAGPVEWARAAMHRLRRQAAVILSPAERVHRLQQLQQPMMTLIGGCSAHLCALEDAEHRTEAEHEAQAFLWAVLSSSDEPRPDTQPEGQFVEGCEWRIRRLVLHIEQHAEPLVALPAYRRNWFRYAAVLLACGISLRYLVRNRDSARQAIVDSFSSVKAFMVEHVQEPLAGMLREILSAERAHFADAAALVDARASLAGMLQSFNANLDPATLSPPLRGADLTKMAQALDMRTVSDRFAAGLDRPIVGLVAGDLLQTLLLQIAALKMEVLSAMSALDQILAANSFNLRVMATIPAIMTGVGVATLLRWLVAGATAPLDTSDARLRFAITIAKVHRLLSEVDDRSSNEDVEDGVVDLHMIRPGDAPVEVGAVARAACARAYPLCKLTEAGRLHYLTCQFKLVLREVTKHLPWIEREQVSLDIHAIADGNGAAAASRMRAVERIQWLLGKHATRTAPLLIH